MKDSTRQTFKSLFKKGDLILVVVFLIAVALTIWLATKEDDGLAQIYVDGELKYELDINSDTTLDLIDGAMTVVVKDGEIWVEESNCAEQLCVQSAHISSEGGMIVCLPNKVVVKIVSKEVDAIS